MFREIKSYIDKKRLEKQIAQASFNCESMEMASDEQWEEMNLNESYDYEKEKLNSLRRELYIRKNLTKK